MTTKEKEVIDDFINADGFGLDYSCVLLNKYGKDKRLEIKETIRIYTNGELYLSKGQREYLGADELMLLVRSDVGYVLTNVTICRASAEDSAAYQIKLGKSNKIDAELQDTSGAYVYGKLDKDGNFTIKEYKNLPIWEVARNDHIDYDECDRLITISRHEDLMSTINLYPGLDIDKKNFTIRNIGISNMGIFCPEVPVASYYGG